MKINANINNAISALNVCELSKFLHLLGNLGGGHNGEIRFWTRQILDQK